MLAGIIQKIGTVKRVGRGEGLVVEIGFEPFARPLEEGGSVAVNGECLTVAKCDRARFTADVLKETVSCTGIGNLILGDKVNLEGAIVGKYIANNAAKNGGLAEDALQCTSFI